MSIVHRDLVKSGTHVVKNGNHLYPCESRQYLGPIYIRGWLRLLVKAAHSLLGRFVANGQPQVAVRLGMETVKEANKLLISVFLFSASR